MPPEVLIRSYNGETSERTILEERARTLVIGSIGPDAPLHHPYITAG